MGNDRLKKILSAAVAICLIGCFILSAVYIVGHADHECAQGDVCPICACINECKKVLEGHAAVAAYVSLLFGLLLLTLSALGIIYFVVCKKTLTELKIRLNN